MTASITLVVLMAVLFGAGISIMLERSLTRVLIGFMLVGNATNLLILLVSGPNGTAPIVTGTASDEAMTDPVPQVLMLTAIVINFGITAFVLALIYRSWWLAQLGDQGDVVPDQHTEDTEAATDATFDAVDLDDAAIQQVLDASNERTDAVAPVPHDPTPEEDR